jgi:uncharacterized protein (TIGR02145 family)
MKFEPIFRIFTLFTLFIFLLTGCGETESPNDDNQIPQNEIKIGSQTWMTKNLDIKKFRNGDNIFHAKNQIEWEKAYEDQTPAWTYFENSEANGKIYGLIYNYYAIIDSRGLGPKDWRIPTILDWHQLVDFNQGNSYAGKRLKSKSYWTREPGTNESGFNALPGGEFFSGYYGEFGLKAAFWTSSFEPNGGSLIIFEISDTDIESYGDVSEVHIPYNSPWLGLMSPGLYVRCIKE